MIMKYKVLEIFKESVFELYPLFVLNIEFKYISSVSIMLLYCYIYPIASDENS